MNMLKKLSIIFLFLLLLLFGGVTFLLLTQTGFHFLLTQASRIIPGLTISQVEGDLRNLTITDAHFTISGVDVQVGELTLSTDLSCIIGSKLCINTLKTRNVRVIVDPAQLDNDQPTEQSESLTDLRLPFPIFVRSIDADNIYVKVDQIVTVELDHFVSGASWQGRAINVLPSQFKKLVVTLPTSAIESISDNTKPLKQSPGERIKTLFSEPLLPELGQFRLPLDIIIQQLNGIDLSLISDSSYKIKSLQLNGGIVESQVRLEKLIVHTTLGSVYLRGQALLDKAWPIELALNSDLYANELKGLRIKANIKGSLLSELALSMNLSGSQRAQINLNTQLAQAGLPLTLNVSSDKLKWPLIGPADYQLSKLDIKLHGNADQFYLGLISSITGKQIPPTTINLTGKGDTQQFEVEQLLITLLQGKLDLNGVVAWSKEISWRAALAIENIKTEQQWPEWPALVNGNVEVKGSLYGGSWQLSLDPVSIKGNIKQKVLNISGAIKGDSTGQWDIANLLVQLGKNRIDLNGEVNSKIALDANINLPTLSDILPELNGNINGFIQLRGTKKAPKLNSQITANHLHWQDFAINNLAMNSDIVSTDQLSGNIKLSVAGLHQDNIAYKTIILNLTGNEQQHQLTLTADGKPVISSINLTGQFDRKKQNWLGTLTQAEFKTPTGLWQLNKSTAINYIARQKKFTMALHCWLNPKAELCFDKPIEVGSSGNISLVLKHFDLTMFNTMQKDVTLTGVFTGTATANWQEKNTLPNVNLHLDSNNVSVKTKLGASSLPLQFSSIAINSTVKEQIVKVNWGIKLHNNGEFNGGIQVDNPQNSRTISGSINLIQLSLRDLQPILNRNESIVGMVDGQLRLSGSLERPRIGGQINLDKVSLELLTLPISIKRGDVSLVFNGSRSLLTGHIATEKGDLDLNGSASWDKPEDLQAKMVAKGKNIRISMPPTVSLDISPNLLITATAKSIDLKGDVAVPWARVFIEELPPSIVSVSSDEVILDSQLKPVTKQQQGIQINTDLSLKIGSDVWFDAFGLNAKLTGLLRVKQDHNGLELHGQVDIPEGRFKAYGQDLLIRKGLLIFAGPPSQPQLDIEAVRNPESTENNVTAGLKVTGFAEQPKIEIFSDPAMSQEQALSYLLRGQGLDSSNGDGDMMTSALIGLGVAGSGKLVGQLGETFGVKDLSLDTQGIGDNSQVVVSGYILPGLQVKYGVGIFDALATLTLRYRLMSNLYLEAVSGVSQALDLLYQFEF